MKAIDVQQLSKTYANGTEALKNLDFSVEEGDFFALLGANGAGKTTVIGILTGLVKKSSGSVRVFGFDLDDQLDDVKRCIGVVPQEFNFNMFERVEDIVVNQAGYFGIPRKEAIASAHDVIERVGLWEKRKATSRQLSGGMKRRLMIARALVHQPRLLILDEPTAGVDVELRHGMWEYLREINQAGTTIVLTTHYLEEVEQMCKHAAIIKDGRMVHHDRVDVLMKLIDETHYLVTVKQMLTLEALQDYTPQVVDAHTLEVRFDQRHDLAGMMHDFKEAGFEVTDFRPKAQRLEALFLKLLNQKN